MTFHAALLVLFIFLLHNVTLQARRDPGINQEVHEGKCVFPFKYNNFYFHDCIRLRRKHKWCSLNSTYQGYWKYCSEDDEAQCAFPFWYRRLIYRSCTEDGDAFGKKWCALTKNYNKDRVWKYC